MSEERYPTRAERARVESARNELGVTEVRRPVAVALVALFLTPLLLVAASDLVRADGRRPFASAFSSLRTVAAGASAAGLFSSNERLHEHLEQLERDLEGTSLVRQLLPGAQVVLSLLGHGNAKVALGDDGWLFYRPALSHLTGRPFLDANSTDPVAAIVDFRDQLAARNVEFLLLPVPVKASVHPSKLAPDLNPPIHNPSWPAFLDRLRDAGIHVVDPTPELLAGGFLRADSHWSPAAVEAVAGRVAAQLYADRLLPPPDGAHAVRPVSAMRSESRQSVGDLARMLALPDAFSLARADSVLVNVPVRISTSPATVVLLGDSFTNVYSESTLGWGVGAGLAEQLAALLGVAVERIARNDDGAWSSRDSLARRIRDGVDPLASTDLVIWQFSARELTLGDWRRIELPTAIRPQMGPAHEPRRVEGQLVTVAPVPQPGATPYRDCITALHLRLDDDTEVLVYTWGMRDGRRVAAASVTPGARMTLTVTPWSQVADRLDSYQRIEPIDDGVLWLDAYWSEELAP